MPEAGLDLDAALFKRLAHRVRDLGLVQGRDQVRHHLDDGDVHAVDVVDVAVLQTDGAGADDDYALRHRAGEVHDLVGGDDLLVVDVEGRDLGGLAADGDDYILGGKVLLLLAGVDLDGVGVDQSGLALHHVDAAALFPQEGLKPEAEVVDDAVFAPVDGLEVHAHGGHVDVDAVGLGLLDGGVEVGGSHERLGRDAAAVDAGAAGAVLGARLYERDLLAAVGAAHGRGRTAGAATDTNYIIIVHNQVPFQQKIQLTGLFFPGSGFFTAGRGPDEHYHAEQGADACGDIEGGDVREPALPADSLGYRVEQIGAAELAEVLHAGGNGQGHADRGGPTELPTFRNTPGITTDMPRPKIRQPT